MKLRRFVQDESGQAIVLLVLALLGLAGFAALALDGGNLYTEQRRAQAAADNAVMAAAYAQMDGLTSNADLGAAALSHAATNDYSNNGINNWVTFYRPPIHGPYAGSNEYMEVVITQTVQTALAHLIYRQNPIPLTVYAVAHGKPQGPLMDGYALAAMRPQCTGQSMIGIEGRGNPGGTWITNGGVFVNGTCEDALRMSGSGETFMVTTDDPINVVGCPTAGDPTCGVSGSVCASEADTSCNYYPAPNVGVPSVGQDPMADIPAPDCPPATTVAAQLGLWGGTTIGPGTYTDIDLSSHRIADAAGQVYMRPGIYCYSGTLGTGNNTLVGHGVLFYLTTVAAALDVSGNGGVELSAPSDAANDCIANPDTEVCQYRGLLVYKPRGPNECSASNHEIDFTGNGFMDVVGTVYAPESLVRYGGRGNLIMTGQTIAGCVKFNGNGAIRIFYDPDLQYSPPPIVRLDE